MKSKLSLWFILLFELQIMNIYASNNDLVTENNIWLTTVDMEGMGEVNFYMQTEISDSCLILKSPKDRDKVIFGNTKARLFRLFQKRENKNSMIVCQLVENGKLDFLFLKMAVKDIEGISTDTIKCTIYDIKSEKQIGKLTAIKTHLSKYQLTPLIDYKQLSDSIVSITEEKIYNPQLVRSKKWRQFVQELSSKSRAVYDDVEFLVLFYSNMSKVKFSHYSLLKTNIDLERTLDEPQIECEVMKDKVVYMNIKSLSGRTEEIDSIFTEYKNYLAYIIDLRSTPGGKFDTTYRLASYLSQGNRDAGMFVCKPYYEDKEHFSNKDNFYTLQEKDFSNFSLVLEKKQVVSIKFETESPIESNIYILTSKNTASACEPLVYGLKGLENVLVVGEKTAGEMLSPTIFPVVSNFHLIVPTADYLTNQWESIEGIGIQPDIKVKAEKALSLVLEKLCK